MAFAPVALKLMFLVVTMFKKYATTCKSRAGGCCCFSCFFYNA
jgi:hypothetical protein